MEGVCIGCCRVSQGSPLASVESSAIIVSIYESTTPSLYIRTHTHTHQLSGPAALHHRSPPVGHLNGTNPDCCKSSQVHSERQWGEASERNQPKERKRESARSVAPRAGGRPQSHFCVGCPGGRALRRLYGCRLVEVLFVLRQKREIRLAGRDAEGLSGKGGGVKKERRTLN